MRNRSGFTLLEVLVAVAVLGLLLVLLNQGVDFGLHATALQEQRQDRTADLPAADAALRRLLAGADPGLYPEPAPFRGNATSVSLLTTVPGPDGSLQPADATVHVQAGALHLRWSPHRHVERFGPAPAPQDLTVLAGIEALRLDYYAAATGTWETIWQRDALPALIRLRVTFAQPGREWPPIIVALPREPLER